MRSISDSKPAVNALLEYGKKLAKDNKEEIKEEILVKKVLVNPVFFVLCCVADKNADADIVWNIPNRISDKSFEEIEKFSREQWENRLKKAGYNRPTKVSQEYVLAIKQIRNKYDGHAEKIWTESKSFSEIIVKFLEFKGIGKKIATMATNMLNRYAGIGQDFSDRHFMDISPDTHVKQVFNMLGFVDDEYADDTNIVVYVARALNPEAPYLLDFPCYYIGKNHCKKRGQKKCDNCPVKDWCKFYKWTFDNDDLFDLVATGKKHATCSLYYGDNKMSRPGDINIIYNSKNEQIKIEITNVQKRRFCDIDEAWAIKEGEGDLSLSYWQNVHEKFFRNIKPDFQNTDMLELNEFRILR